MFLESEWEGPGVSICLGLWNIPVLRHLHGCQTDNKPSTLLRRKKEHEPGAKSGALYFYLVFATSKDVNDSSARDILNDPG